MSDANSPPPASMNMLISMLATQAAASMGMIAIPGQEKNEVRLDLAKHFIDMLEILENKTKGNLDNDEAQMLQGTMHQLRLMFVEKTKASA